MAKQKNCQELALSWRGKRGREKENQEEKTLQSLWIRQYFISVYKAGKRKCCYV